MSPVPGSVPGVRLMAHPTQHRSLFEERFRSVARRKEIFHLTTHSTHLRLYGVRHMVKDPSDSERGNRCRHIGYSFRLTARIILYASSYRQDNTYHDLCYTSRGALARTRNSSMGSPVSR